MSIANAAHCCMIGGGKKWVNPYVADGLVFDVNACWNAGRGIVSQDNTKWIDSVDGIELTVVNGEFANNAVILTGGNIYNTSIPVLTSAVGSGEFTVEYGGFFYPREGLTYLNESAGFKIGGNASRPWVSGTDTAAGNTFWSKTNLYSATAGDSYPMRYESRWGWNDSMAHHPSPDTSSSLAASLQAGIGIKPCIVHMVGHAGEGWSYVDGVQYNSAYVNLGALYKMHGFALGSYLARSNMAYYFFHVYNRALSSSERAFNIDIAHSQFNFAI